jgi:hypothetical protein
MVQIKKIVPSEQPSDWVILWIRRRSEKESPEHWRPLESNSWLLGLYYRDVNTNTQNPLRKRFTQN